MAIGNFLFGTDAKTQQLSTKTPQQLGWLNQSGQQASQGLANTNLDYAPIKQEIMRKFQTETVPGLLEQLQGMAGNGSRGGSALGAQLGGSLENLGSILGSQESQYNLQKHQALLQQLGLASSPQFENLQFNAQPGLLQGLAGGVGQGAGQALPLYALLSQFQNQKTGSSTGQTPAAGTDTSNASNWLPLFLSILGGLGGAAAGGPAGALLGSNVGGGVGSYFGGK